MQFDDRLATVLRHRAAGETAARTQFRQLLDLLGSRRVSDDKSLLAAAWLRLAALGEMIPATERAGMLREPGLRFRNPELAYHLAEDEPEVAAAALAHARLAEDDWNALVPRLPIRARGFLRLRRDLPPSTQELLERLGIHDRGLPMPDGSGAEPQGAPNAELPIPANDSIATAELEPEDEAQAVEPLAAEDEGSIGALVRRIESFRKARAESHADRSDAPRLPLGEKPAHAPPPVTGFGFTADTEGRIVWADRAVAPMVIGARLSTDTMRRAVLLRQPIRMAAIDIAGAPGIEGSWIVDAMPRFARPSGQFSGYAGKFRRPPHRTGNPPDTEIAPEADRLRQLLHELRTPANAIQGFAEVIQQQVFGPAPHEYRALAASIAGDGARILAGFDEIDRLARLETGALELDEGASDVNTVVGAMVGQLQAVLAARTAGFDFLSETVGSVPMAPTDCEGLTWRVLATIAGAVGAGEQLRVELSRHGNYAKFACELPASLAGEDDLFETSGKAPGGTLRAGMFGAGFSLRLARAEAQAVGGNLSRVEDWLIVTLPLLTGSAGEPSQNSAA
ncbi:histidine kinase dimerization/phospho-acceptor domain-containing protein [Parerythrobacter lacustris]|uniref:histidine kinase n=1 Tax=Parerythrobacter lacustris TaxID=2969984 RepID=A0ABT1XPQ4_9SPHN|nr:histidine kinase dimerization/phospho-acceptor domain-containing protein [Parerythrobacter lacustris]MCR2832906.1 sensor histidine kinase [Parerythrobacter lacustris]